MSYFIIETFKGSEYATIITDTDGNNVVFENRGKAEKGDANCQCGLIVEI